MHRQPRVWVPVAVMLWLLAAASAIATSGDVRLIDAAKNRDLDTVRALLNGGVDVNAAWGDGATALHWAAYRDDPRIADLLMDAGADVNSVNDLGVTPLALAAANGSPILVSRLLGRGADPNIVSRAGVTPLMQAAKTGGAEAARLLLAGGADVNARENERQQSALMWAASQGHVDVIGVLLEHGADVDARSMVRHTWFRMDALSSGDERLLRTEIPQGGSTPLLFVARQGSVQSAGLLLAAEADVNALAADGTSALVVAARSGHSDLVKYLLHEGAEPNAAGAGYTALHLAVLRSDLDLVETLLAAGADPNVRLARGTPLRRFGLSWDFPERLLGATPLFLAASLAEPEILQSLAASGADPRVGVDGATPLLAAARVVPRLSRPPVPRAPDTCVASAGFRVECDSDSPEKLLVGGHTPSPDPEMLVLETVKVLVGLGVDVNATSKTGDGALHGLARYGYSSVIKFLAAHGASLDMRNSKGETPLSLIRETIERGAGQESERSKRVRETARLLRELGALE